MGVTQTSDGILLHSTIIKLSPSKKHSKTCIYLVMGTFCSQRSLCFLVSCNEHLWRYRYIHSPPSISVLLPINKLITGMRDTGEMQACKQEDNG